MGFMKYKYTFIKQYKKQNPSVYKQMDLKIVLSVYLIIFKLEIAFPFEIERK